MHAGIQGTISDGFCYQRKMAGGNGEGQKEIAVKCLAPLFVLCS